MINIINNNSLSVFFIFLIKKNIKIKKNLQYFNIIIFPNKKLKKKFINYNFLLYKKCFLSQCFTFINIDKYVTNFIYFNKKIINFNIYYNKYKLINIYEIFIILNLIINKLKKKINNFYIFYKIINITYLSKTILEIYYYQYDFLKFIPYSKTEKIFQCILKEFEKYLYKCSFLIKPQSVNFVIKNLIINWKNIFLDHIILILPQIEYKYIENFIDYLYKYKNIHLFINKCNLHYFRNFFFRNIIYYNNKNLHIKKKKIENIYIQKINKLDFYNLNIIYAQNQLEESKLISLFIKKKIFKGIKSIYIQTKSYYLSLKIEQNLNLWSIKVNNLLNKKYKKKVFFLGILSFLKLNKIDYNILLDILQNKICIFYNTDILYVFELKCLKSILYRNCLLEYLFFIKCNKLKIFIYQIYRCFFVGYKNILSSNIFNIFYIHYKIYKYLNKKKIICDFMKNEVKLLNIYTLISFELYYKIINKIIFFFFNKKKIIIKELVTINKNFKNINHEIFVFSNINKIIFFNYNKNNKILHYYTRIYNKIKKIEKNVYNKNYELISFFDNINILLSYNKNYLIKNSFFEFLLIIKNNYLYNITEYLKKIENIFFENQLNKKNFFLDNRKLPTYISIKSLNILLNNFYIYYCRYIINIIPTNYIIKNINSKYFFINIYKVLFLIPNCKKLTNYKRLFTDIFYRFIKIQLIPYYMLYFWKYKIYKICINIHNFLSEFLILFDYKKIFCYATKSTKKRKIKIINTIDRIIISKKYIIYLIYYKLRNISKIINFRKKIDIYLSFKYYILIKKNIIISKNLYSIMNIIYLDIINKKKYMYNRYKRKTFNVFEKFLNDFFFNKNIIIDKNSNKHKNYLIFVD